VTIARSLSDTFAGIRPADVVPFVLAQFAGGIAATFAFRWLASDKSVGPTGVQAG
jgi:glycerol uptake facilitator-like aquaporin